MSTLKSWFGPSRNAVWEQLCAQIGGKLIPGSLWNGERVEAKHGEWTITLDTHTVSTGRSAIQYTRLRAPYVNRDGFRFTIYRHGAISELGKWFGMQDVEVGDPQFDHDFVIQGNNEGQVRALFADERLRELIKSQPAVFLTVKDDEGWFAATFPKGVDELCFLVPGVIQDAARLKQLYDLFAETLDHLCRIGSAYENEPHVTL